MGLLGTLAAATASVLGYTVQNVTIVYWTQAAVSNLGILFLCGSAFAALFGGGLALFAYISRDPAALYCADDPAERALLTLPCGRARAGRGLTQAQILVVVGVLNALNGFGIVYASPPDRTPPLVQAILQNAAVIWSVPFSKAALGDRKVYCALAPARAAAVILASVAVSLAPTFAHATGERLDASALGWIGVYIAGLGFGAAYNVFQQLYFIRAGALRPGVGALEATRHTLRALFFANLVQPVVYLVLAWMDVLPWFGTSSDGSAFAANFGFSLACSVGGPDLARAAGYAVGAAARACPASTPVWAWVFIAGYAVSYVGAAQLNRESATFSMLCFVVITMTTAAFWLIPGTNPNPSATPLWSVLTSLALSLGGSAAWKAWEAGTMPPEEQFAVGPADGGKARGGRGVTFDGDELDAVVAGGGGVNDEGGIEARLLYTQ